MAVTFGTPVTGNGSSSSKSCAAISLTGITSGQPLILVLASINGAGDTTVSATDTFATPYTWTTVVKYGYSSVSIVLMIGTGGAGTSGAVTGTNTSSSDYVGGCVIPCNGASTAAGLSAIDVSGYVTQETATINSPSLTPTAAGEGAVYAGGGGINITASPGSPWVDNSINCGGSYSSSIGVATYQSPASGVALATSWTQGSSTAGTIGIGLIVKAAVAVTTAIPQSTRPSPVPQIRAANF